jgi:hypothetical protein
MFGPGLILITFIDTYVGGARFDEPPVDDQTETGISVIGHYRSWVLVSFKLYHGIRV